MIKPSFICPTWGMDTSDPASLIATIKESGYDGVEIGFPQYEHHQQEEILDLAKKQNLIVIAQHYDVEGDNIKKYSEAYSWHLAFLASLEPDFINAQSGRDYFSMEENCQVLEISFEIENKTGVKIIHETHRGKFSYSLPLMQQYFDRFPNLRVTADFSHYCVVSESLLESPHQKAMLASCIERADHIHARVGYPQGAQVNDPRTNEWKNALEIHLSWWDSIIEQKRNDESITICPEFGPPPYMPTQPHSRQPLADQWEVNLFMMETLRERWQLKSKKSK